MPKRPRTSGQVADSSTPKGGSAHGEVPTLDKESLQKLIRENELEEEKKRQSAATASEGSYAYQQGDTVHGKVGAAKAQQQEELNEILRAEPGQIPGISSSLVFCVGLTMQGCGWRHHTGSRLFGSLRFTVSHPT